MRSFTIIVVTLSPSHLVMEGLSPATNYIPIAHDLSLPERTVLNVKIYFKKRNKCIDSMLLTNFFYANFVILMY